MLRLSRLTRLTSATTPSIRLGRSGQRLAGALHLQTPPSRWPEGGVRRFGTSRVLEQEVNASVDRQISTPRLSLEQHDAVDFAKTLPLVCPGCGAMSQTVEQDQPGFYSPKKRHIKKADKQHEDDVFEKAMARMAASGQEMTLAEENVEDTESTSAQGPPICDRCHDLIHQSKGNPILHPSMQSIQDIIESSPHKNNHIYHVLDAADFPMSLIPNLMSSLRLPRLRTQNRRSKHRTYTQGRMADVSFIITRSDLLAPQKEQVDHMMPYLQEVLRDALGRTNKNARLGSVRCVSARRGWWTPNVKQEIWDRGGAGWVVGKVNVGKSALFEVVFPKGRNQEDAEAGLKVIRRRGASFQDIENEKAAQDMIADAEAVALSPANAGDETAKSERVRLNDQERKMLDELNSALTGEEEGMVIRDPASAQDREIIEDDVDDEDDISLLPPAQPETAYPHMPIVSALPGTTASPIRIPFGNGRGELIDLPGVQRSSLETHVLPEHHSSLVMKSRVVPEQHTLKPGQSLLLGGLIRITPKTDDLIFLAYPFTPLKAHATGNEKAVAIQTGMLEDGLPYTGTIENIGTEKAKGRIKSAGTFRLEWDVTKKRAGPVTDKTAGKQKAENLPFIVYGADILIEGVGWVELVCQVRSRRQSLLTDALSSRSGDSGSNADFRPEVEVFTPKGKFIGIRRPMNAWLTSGPKKVPKHAQRVRPRMTISVHKRREGGKKGGQKAATMPT